MKVEELASLVRQPVDVGGVDLAAVDTGIGPAHIIGNDEKNVRSFRSTRAGGGKAQEGCEQGNSKKANFHGPPVSGLL